MAIHARTFAARISAILKYMKAQRTNIHVASLVAVVRSLVKFHAPIGV